MSGFLTFCQRFTPLEQEVAEELDDKLKSREVDKGEKILRAGEICRHIYHIDEGLTKLCFNSKDKEFIMRFFPEGSMFTVLDSYLQQKPSTYMVLALEPTIITYIHQPDMEALCKKHHSMETFFRKLLSFASLNMMKRITEMLEEDASARYNNFVNENNPLLQRISLGDLAAYLGITQVSLSRIRGKK